MQLYSHQLALLKPISGNHSVNFWSCDRNVMVGFGGLGGVSGKTYNWGIRDFLRCALDMQLSHTQQYELDKNELWKSPHFISVLTQLWFFAQMHRIDFKIQYWIKYFCYQHQLTSHEVVLFQFKAFTTAYNNVKVSQSKFSLKTIFFFRTNSTHKN